MSKKISIGQVSDFPAGKAQVVNAESTAIIITRVDDNFYVLAENGQLFLEK